MKSRTSTPSKLRHSVSQRLDAYAIAATAANGDACGLHSDSVHHSQWPYLLGGMGMLGLGLAVPSEAKIVYTPANILIQNGSSRTNFYPLDLNQDGIADMVFSAFCGGFAGPDGTGGCFLGVDATGIEVGTKGHGWARAMKMGAHIGHAKQFSPAALMAGWWQSDSGYGRSGYWWYSEPRYLGVAFQINGKTHYGWVRLKKNYSASGTVTGYAYETIPGRSLKAGQKKGTDDTSVEEQNASVTSPTAQSATLGALAMGPQGMSIWRRKEAVGTIVSSH